MMMIVVVVIVRHAGLRFALVYSNERRANHPGRRRSSTASTRRVGRAASWCALAIVLIGFAVVLLRYVLGLGSIWLQESILYAHAALFLLAAAWTLKEGGHVRVDVFYASASPRVKAWVDLLGVLLLLLPFCIAIIWFSWPYVARSWAILERSRETSGLPLVFLLKTLDPAVRRAAGVAGALAGDQVDRDADDAPHRAPRAAKVPR